MDRVLLPRTGTAFTHAGDTPGMFCTYPSVRLDYKFLSISASCSPIGVLFMEPAPVSHVLGTQSGGRGAPRAGEGIFLSHMEGMV